MGYDLHITRREYWFDEEGPEISLADWLDYLAIDPSLRRDVRFESRRESPDVEVEEPTHAVWTEWPGQTDSKEMKFWLDAGNVVATDADEHVRQKMFVMADVLGGQLQGTKGELYNSIGEPDGRGAPKRKAPRQARKGQWKLWLLLLLAIALVVYGLSVEAQTANVKKGITYAQSGQKLDLCRPTGERRETGLIFIHGGGFSSGNRGAMSGYCELLAKGGFPSVTISYRLTSAGHAFPAALQDLSAAISWMRANSKTLGIDPNKIVLIGYSAGGTLAMTAGLANGSNIAGVVSAAGISDFASARNSTPHAKLRQDIDAYLGKASSAAASPLSQVSRGDPPVFLFHGKNDRLVPISQSVIMSNALKSKGVKVLFRAFDNAGHEIMLPNKHLKTLLRDMTRFLVAIDAR